MRIYAEIKTIFQGYVIRIRKGARDVSAPGPDLSLVVRAGQVLT